MKAFIRTACICTSLGVPIGITAPAAAAALPCGPEKLTPVVRSFGDEFGDAIAIDGDTVVVGVPRDDGVGIDQGSAYVYRWIGTGWVEEAKITAPDGANFDRFGSAVAIDGNTIIVGAAGDDLLPPLSASRGGVMLFNAGSAYIFTRSGTTWSMQTKLTAFDAFDNDNFGFSVAINGGTAVIGSPFDDDAGQSSGSVYVFRFNGTSWVDQAKITALNAANGDQFGFAVANHDDSIIVGARFAVTALVNGGAAYVFTRDGTSWTQQDRLTALDAANGDQFGYSVALEADSAVIGALLHDHFAIDEGSAYVFTRDASSLWSQQMELVANDASAFDNFGTSVGISGDTVVVGAPHDDDFAPDSGSSYIFTRSGTFWSMQAKLIAPDPSSNSQFGDSVAIDGDTVVTGAVFEGASVPNASGGSGDRGITSGPGAAYVFQRIGSFWIGPDQVVTSSDGEFAAEFGSAVAMNGDTVLIGAIHAEGEIEIVPPLPAVPFVQAVPDAGAVFVFRWDGSRWKEEAKLMASDGETGDAFGWSVALDGDTAIIGAIHDNIVVDNEGSAYIFERSGTSWLETKKLTALDGKFNDAFGVSVAISGDTALVGAELGNGIVADTGTVHVFTRDFIATGFAGWTRQTILVAVIQGIGDRFGCSVALEGDVALIGSRLDDDLGGGSGSAYIFKRNNTTWSQTDKLLPADGGPSDNFGTAVALSGDNAVVTSPGDDDGGSASGAAYVFANTGTQWVEEAKLKSFDAAINDEFGTSAAVAGDTVVIGSIGDDVLGSSSGSAYVFQGIGSAWRELRKVTHPLGSPGDELGFSVATNGTFAVACAPLADDVGLDAGAAFFFTVAERCLSPLVHNVTADTIHASLADAVNFATSTHVLVGTVSAFTQLAPLDYLGKLLSIASTKELSMPFPNTISLANGASLNTAPGDAMTLYGLVDLPSGATSTFRAGSLRLGAGGQINVFPGATLSLQIPNSVLEGSLTVFPGASVSSAGPLAVDGEFTLLNSVLSAPIMEVGHGGRFVGGGSLSGSVVNRDQFITIDSTVISGDLFNAGGARLTVQIGTLTLLGLLTNDGIIIGDLQSLLLGASSRSATQPGDGFSVVGAYHAGAQASLLMASDLWRVSVGGDFDMAITGNTRFDMAQAELNINGAFPTDFEIMSTDIGNSTSGLDRTLSGHYPLGTLRLSGNITTLVDRHDNDGLGQVSREAIYVSTLIIESGATLKTGAFTVYYQTLINNGTVDNEANLVQLIGFCVGDADGDGLINFNDITSVLSNWLVDHSPGTGPGDANQDGIVDFNDITAVLSNWLQDCPV